MSMYIEESFSLISFVLLPVLMSVRKTLNFEGKGYQNVSNLIFLTRKNSERNKKCSIPLDKKEISQVRFTGYLLFLHLELKPKLQKFC